MFVSAATATPALAVNGDRIVRTKSSDGLGVITSACKLLGCYVLGSLDTVPGQTQPSSLFLVRGLVDTSAPSCTTRARWASPTPSFASPAPWITTSGG